MAFTGRNKGSVISDLLTRSQSEQKGPVWTPHAGPQTKFLASSAYEVLFGGAAGGGKSAALLMIPLRYIGSPTFRGLLLRRTFPELQRSLIERAFEWYKIAGGKPADSGKKWRFPSGAVIEFGHLEHTHDVTNYQSSEYQFIGFDELTTFEEYQYTYMLSRARSASGLPVRIRSASNPGGIGHEWVMRRWGPWLDRRPGYKGPVADAGQTLHFLNTDHGEVQVPTATTGSLSRVFIPARVTDNPTLMKADPAYLSRLGGLDAVTRAQLRDGDWLAHAAAGMVFKRAWFGLVEAVPANATRLRYWDRAATEDAPGRNPDFTVGMKMARDQDGAYFIEDIVRFRGTPGDVEKTIRQTAELDGRDCAIGIEQDPGQAGKFEAGYYIRALSGFDVRAYPVTKDKITRARPASAQAEAGNIKLLHRPWVAALLDELEAFPEYDHDDQVDALSGAFAALQAPMYSSGVSDNYLGEYSTGLGDY